MSEVYYIRDYKESDKAFVLATFLRGLYYGDSWFSLMPKDVFMKNYKPIIEALVARNFVKVACLIEDPDVIIGYSILSQDFQVIHWVFVKKAFRGMGIGKRLIHKFLKAATHLTKTGKSLLTKYETCIFNPFAV
jgi:GNAT superfamily N-acetyltransferase